MKTIYHLVASTAHGIFEVEDGISRIHYTDECLPLHLFLSYLPDLADDWFIATAVGPDQLAELIKEGYQLELLEDIP